MGWAPGDTVGQRYKLERLIGEGGMGVVWAAVHLVTRKPVALKALRVGHTSDKQLLQRFLREARAACAVRHPNVVEIHDVLDDDGLPIMVMDLLEGESLGQRVERDRSIPLDELLTFLLPVVSAVAAAHAVGIVHRDLKPDNIFLSRTSAGIEVKVLDFGIAKLTATDGDAAATGGLTGTGAMLGTPYYMAPEQIYGEKDIDHRADIWAIGVILYECLAGVRPTQADSIGGILKIVTRDGVKPLREWRPDLPAPLLDLVDRMLSAERSKRPNNLTEVSDILTVCKGAPTVGQSQIRTSDPAALRTSSIKEIEQAATINASPATLSSTTTTTVGSSKKSSRRATLTVVGVVIAGAVGLTAFLGLRTPSIGATQADPSASRVDPLASVATVVQTTTASVLPTLPSASASTTPTTSTAHHSDSTHKPDAAMVSAPTVPTPSVSASTQKVGGVVDKAPF